MNINTEKRYLQVTEAYLSDAEVKDILVRAVLPHARQTYSDDLMVKLVYDKEQGITYLEIVRDLGKSP